MTSFTSPRLPGLPLLQAQPSGPAYSRWRRGLKFALETKGVWKYCNGQCTMPMPEAGATSPTASTANLQPSLLEERRNWVRHDREVKLDIFLSLTEDVMQEVFDEGPPLPPSNLTAQDMLDALDDTYAEFRFEAYHHTFCHFLNLHVDQYASIEDFNQEFLMTLEDLLDHGHPLSNVQACSAYFSKLRCTQNPWVNKKLEEWDAQPEEIDCLELLKEGESPSWSIIRPLETKPSQILRVDSIPEEYLEDSSASDSDSCRSTVSSVSLPSQQKSEVTVHNAQSQEVKKRRQESVATTSSFEITVHVSSDDIPEANARAPNKESRVIPSSAIPERKSSKDQVNGTSITKKTEALVPERLVSTDDVYGPPLPPPHNRPLPPLPPQALPAKGIQPLPRSKSPRQFAMGSANSSQASLTGPTLPTSSAQLPITQLEATHPAMRPQTITTLPTPLEVHPALRSVSLSSAEQVPTQHEAQRSTARHSSPTAEHKRPVTSSTSLAVPWPSTPDVPARPHSSRAMLPFSQAPNPLSSQADAQAGQVSNDSDASLDLRLRRSNVSEISLPLQGARDSAWEYLYQSKGGYLVKANPSPREHSVSPVSSSSLQAVERVPTFEDTIVPRSVSPESKVGLASGKNSTRDFVARLSGDSLLESSEEVKEREKKQKKKRSWGVGVNLARFTPSKGVKEIV